MARIIKANSSAAAEASPPAMSLTEIAAEARSVILDARKQAARIAAEARASADAACGDAAKQGYEEGLARGQHDGYADGHKQGLADGSEQFAAEAAELIELLERMARELAGARGQRLHDGRCEMLDFAVELAEKIVGRVASKDPAAARENLRKALELAGASRRVSAHVHPGQLAALRRSLPKLTEALGRGGRVELVADERISPGGVRLLRGSGEIDATIETQWSNVVEALVGEAPVEPAAPGRYEPADSQGDRTPAADGPAKAALVLAGGPRQEGRAARQEGGQPREASLGVSEGDGHETAV